MHIMHSYMYLKQTDKFPLEIAHLYEHLVIEGFYSYVHKELGIDAGVTGYIGGETYCTVQFIEAWLYDKSVAIAFATYILHQNRTWEFIDRCIEQCESESRESWKIMDEKSVKNQLNELDQLPWQSINDVPPFRVDEANEKLKSPIQITKAASQFKSIVISTYLENASLEDKVLFMRLNVIIEDIVGSVIRQHGWYKLDSHMPIEKDRYIFSVVSANLPKASMTTKQIENMLEDVLHSFDTKKNMSFITSHFEAFKDHPTWIGNARDQLHYINFVASNHSIARLATIERVTSVLQNTMVKVENAPHKFASHLEY